MPLPSPFCNGAASVKNFAHVDEADPSQASTSALNEGADFAVGHSKKYDRLNPPHQWRICFRWTASGPEDVTIVDYH